jgi:spore germination protein KC
MKKIFRSSIYCVLILALLMVSGCWDSKEVENLAITTLVAWDRITENGVDQWQITTRILNMAGNQGGGEGGQKPGASEILIKGKGLTAQEAFLDITKRLPSRIFYQHSAAMIIGERAAKEDLPNILSNVMRFPGTRYRNFILVSRGEAFRSLQAQPELVSLLSKEVRMLANRTAEQEGASERVTILDFARRTLREDRDTILPEIQIYLAEEGEKTASPTVLLEGLGVIRKTKLVGWLNPEESLGYLLVTGKSQDSEIPISTTYGGNILVSYFLTGHKSEIESELIEGKPRFIIKIKADGVVHEINAPVLGIEEIPLLEEAASKRIQEIVWKTISKSKEYDADFLGLNENLHRYHLSDWKEIESHWRDFFQDADIEVEVEAKVRNFGASTKKLDIPQ